MTKPFVSIAFNDCDELQELWTANDQGHVVTTGSFDFTSRVKDNLVALFNVGGRLGVMSVLSTTDTPDDSVSAVVEAYGDHVGESAVLLDYAVLIDYTLHEPDDAQYATVFRWEPGSPTESEVRHDLLVVLRGVGAGLRTAQACGAYADLPLDQTALDFLSKTKLI